jgi:ceramide glucosyltransferase
MIESLALAGLGISAAAYLVSLAAALALRRRSRGAEIRGATPAVSIVKPLSGADEGLEENLESFFLLDYESFEVVFSFASRDDPAFGVARRVADRHPERATTFVFDAREPGGNPKVNRLAAAVPYAKHRLLLFSDGNVRVRPNFLRRAVTSFAADPSLGLVSHLFRATGARSPGSRLETLYLNGCLLPGTAAVAAVLRRPCVVGKSILVTRRALEAIGGIATLRDHLAEDYLLGEAVRRAGYRVALSADVLDTTEIDKPLGRSGRGTAAGRSCAGGSPARSTRASSSRAPSRGSPRRSRRRALRRRRPRRARCSRCAGAPSSRSPASRSTRSPLATRRCCRCATSGRSLSSGPDSSAAR